MNKFVITVTTPHGQVRMVIEAKNYEAADAFAQQMNQGFVTTEEAEDD